MGYTILYYYKTPSGLIGFSYMPHVKQAMRMSNISMRLPIIRVELLLFMGPNLPLGL